MKILFDFFPVILFFSVFKWGESHSATAQSVVTQFLSGLISGGTVAQDQAAILLASFVAIVATFGQIGYLLARRKKVDTMLWISLVIISFFGGATIYFHNETFIKWKPTVLYWCFAGSIFFSQILFKKNLIRLMMEEQIKLPDEVWTRLSMTWTLFFTIMGLINLYVAFSFATSVWVNFKLFGGMGLMVLFVIGQSVYLTKYIKETE